ncbi:MAG: non-homologous end-joining DNA ligase [Actinobacteria bacterium]|nr:non-homologous end-joining DNA ligase [Actinomycetota bacterium]
MARKAKLSEYERRRNFGKTEEPAPKRTSSARKEAKAGRSAKSKRKPRFVVQEHSARRLHWDLRLEHDGVAASWAIPNGIPMDPKQNRKAIRTEDHPLEYLGWEGEIPAGEYGAGTMRVWDSGTYELEKWTDGKVMAAFAGERVRGRYAIFRAGESDRDWMIHRIDPPERELDPFPEAVVPMLAKLAPLPSDDRDWAVEVKWDGVRAIAYCRPGRLELQTRNLNTVTASYPEVRRLSRQLGSRDAVLDGELVAFDEAGRPSFERLQQRIHRTEEAVVRRRTRSHPVTYVIFDLLHLDGRNLMEEPYGARRELLDGLGLEGESWQTPAHSVGRARELLAAAAEHDLEGIVLKRLDSRYLPGKRTGSWLKVKNVGRQEFVIGGWLPGEGRRQGTLGALLLGYQDPGAEAGGELRYAGKVGTGFSDRDLAELVERLRPLARDSNPFGRRGPRGAHYVEPRLVAEVEYRELTSEGMIRHGSFKGLREDKPAAAVELEREAGIPSRDYYAAIAEVLLPHLRGRPLTMERCPDGVEGPHACLVEDLPTLIRAADLGNVELRASLSLATAMERPTAMVFELDPGPPSGLLECAQVALWLRGLFDQLGLRSYPKTSGSGGLHLLLPLNSEVGYERTKPFAKAVAETLAAKFGDSVAATTAKRERAGRVMIDWTPNDRDRTTVAVYSLRARSRPTVSTPVEWEELEVAQAAGDPDRLVFDAAAVVRRVERLGDLQAPLLSEVQELPDLG